MANLVFGTVVFHGNKDGLKKLGDILNRIGTSSLRELVENICPEYDGDCRYVINDYNIHDNDIFLWCELAWDAHEDMWKAISDKLGINWSAYFEWDDESPSIYNDEEQVWFHENYILDAEDSPIGDYTTFATAEEFTKYMENKTGIRLDPEDWNSNFYDDEWLEEELGWKGNYYARLWIADREIS